MRKVFILFCFLSIVYVTKSQDLLNDKRIQIDYKHKSVKSIINDLSKKSALHFSYSNDILKSIAKITISGEFSFERILDTIFLPHNIDYQLIGNQIVLFENDLSETNEFTLHGYIFDKESHENLVGATIYFPDLEIGITTNNYGFYSMTLPKGKQKVQIQYLGYIPIEKEIIISSDLRLNWYLENQNIELGEIVVAGNEENSNSYQISTNYFNLNSKKIKEIPYALGEADIAKSIEQLPGVHTIAEGTSGLFVRGGNSDQNLFLLDEAPLFNSTHFVGLFSIFNPDAIQNVNFYKAGIPSRYGNRASSVLDIKMKEGDMNDYHLAGGIGLISSRLTIEGPIKKSKSSFIVSGRRTYLDLLLKASKDPEVSNNTIYFYDLNPKFNFYVNSNNRIYVSGYFGRDKYAYKDLAGFTWGNYTSTIRWNRIIDEKMFMNATFITSDYRYNYEIGILGNGFIWKSNIQTYEFKFDFTRYFTSKTKIDFGLNDIYHYFAPVDIEPEDSSSFITEMKLDRKITFINNAYVHFFHEFNSKFKLDVGTRINSYQILGPYKKFEYEYLPTNSNVIDTIHYEEDEIPFTHFSFEPRMSILYIISNIHSLKLQYNRSLQYIQTISYSGGNYPGDRWVPASPYIKPLKVNQLSFRYHYIWEKMSSNVNLEFFNKWTKNQIDKKNNSDVGFSNNIESQLYQGNATSFGFEFMMNKQTGDFNAQVAYTWSKTWLKINEVNSGKAYHPYFDRRHNFSAIASYKFKRRFVPALLFTYTSGRPISLPIGKYQFENYTVPLFDDENMNAERLPAYHRLDFSLDILPNPSKSRKWKSYWNISIYNVYARKNPISIIYKEVINGDPYIFEDDPDLVIESREYLPVSIYFMQFVPTITYNFKF